MKFLINREGQAVARYKPAYDPLDFEGDVSALPRCTMIVCVVQWECNTGWNTHAVRKTAAAVLCCAALPCGPHSCMLHATYTMHMEV